MSDKDHPHMAAIGRNPAAICKAADPLIAWYAKNKPQVLHLRLTDADMRQLESAVPRTLMNNRIIKVNGKFFYGEFELRGRVVSEDRAWAR